MERLVEFNTIKCYLCDKLFIDEELNRLVDPKKEKPSKYMCSHCYKINIDHIVSKAIVHSKLEQRFQK